MISRLELSLYCLIWTSSVFYAMYRFHLMSDMFANYFTEDLEPGWKLVDRKQDTADFEWKTWTPILMNWLQYSAIYLVFSQILKMYNHLYLSTFSIFISFLWLLNNIGLSLSVFIFVQPIILISILYFLSLSFVWATGVGFTLALHSSNFENAKDILFQGDLTREYLFSVILAWTHARSISFLVDTRNTPLSWKKLKDFFHYCFYLPLLPSGPLVLYLDFKRTAQKTPSDWSGPNRLQSVFLICRCAFWWFFHQFSLHYFYHSAMQYHPGLVGNLDVWSAGGLGYCLGQFFMIKYVVMYGLPSRLAALDRVEAPPPPKCIGRIHLYSQMWRDFDRGLYNFMLTYIYIPCTGSHGGLWTKLWGSFVCFSFVCIWHGASSAVIIWCISNFIGICLETTANYLSKQRLLVQLKQTLSDSSWTRLKAAVASPLLLMSALSNFYFFTDTTVGYLLARKAIYDGGAFRLLTILSIMYCCCHVSMAVNQATKKNNSVLEEKVRRK